MDQVHIVRHKVLVEGRSQRAVARELGLARVTVRKYLTEAVPLRRVEAAPRPRPVWDAVAARVAELNAGAAGRPPNLAEAVVTAPTTISAEERVEELRAPRNGIAGEVLTDAKAGREIFTGTRTIGGRLDPEVVRLRRGRDEQKDWNQFFHGDQMGGRLWAGRP